MQVLSQDEVPVGVRDQTPGALSNSLPLRHKLLPDKKNEESVVHGELKIAQEALQSVTRCKWAADTERGIRKELDKPLLTNPTPEAWAAEENKIKLLQDNLTKVKALRENCAEMTDKELDIDVYDKLLAAARLGDKNAASCYVVASIDAPSLQADPAAFDEYNRNAADLIQRGITAGDWSTVYLLEAGTGPAIGQSSWFSSLFVHDELTSYRYSKLRRLGTANEEAEELDAQLARQARRLIENGIAAPDDILKADQWAQEMYRTYFATSQPLVGTPELCSDPTGGLQGTVM